MIKEIDMKRGDNIRTPKATIETVLTVDDCNITTYENGSYHPTKVFQVWFSATLKNYVTIPQ